jgi:chromosome partitioning protein
MGRIVAVTNLKGGIGKTTTVVNVGAGLALKGARVLLVDVDAQGNLALALGLSPRRTLYEALVDGARAADCVTPARPNLDLLAADESLLSAQPTLARRPDWSRALEQVLRPLKRDYDFIFVDCGGSMTVLNVNALIAASDVMVPTTVEHLSMKGMEKLFKQVAGLKNSVGTIRIIVPTLFDPRLKQSTALLEQLQTTYGSLVAPPIRVNVRLSESSAAGRTIYEFDRRSRGALDYAQLVERLSTIWSFNPEGAVSPIEAVQQQPATPVQNGHPPTPVPDARVPHPPTADAAPAVPNQTHATDAHDQPVVTGAGNVLQLTCPHCGRPLRRATVAGYRVAYCDHCKYKQQELASDRRR